VKLPRRQFLHLTAGAAALPVVSRTARAQVYPSRPITIVVPFPAGGSTDVIGRILAEKMRASLGQTIIIENVGAAGGSIGVGRVARAAPHGYTLDIGQWDTHVANGAA
jgi:tripartite-type tricarboxylate transporter receptor subunit TctC